MEVAFSEQFRKAYQKRIKGNSISEKAFKNSLAIFINDPFDARLKTHKLSGKLKELWSFSVTYSQRIVFYFSADKPAKAVFVDIGSHDEVY